MSCEQIKTDRHCDCDHVFDDKLN